MKHVLTVALIALAYHCLCLATARGQHTQGVHDSLQTDSVVIEFEKLPDAGSGDGSIELALYVFNDGNHVVAMGVGFDWLSSASIALDSVAVEPAADTAFDYAKYYYYKNNIDSSNAAMRFMFAGASMGSGGLPPDSNRQKIATYYFTASNWSAVDSIAVDSVTFSSATRLEFAAYWRISYVPFWAGSIAGYDRPCCVGDRGNVDCDPQDQVTISDYVRLQDYLFGSGAPLCCPSEADLDDSRSVTIADLTILWDHLFGGMQPLIGCN